MEAAGIVSCVFGLGLVCHSAASNIPGVYRTSKQYNNVACKVHILYPRRLALVVFLAAAAIWSVLQFVSLLLLTDISCNIITVFIAFFDQLARVSIAGVALWGVRGPIEDAAERMTLLVFLMLRCVLAVVVIAFTRFTFIPVCFPQASPEISHGKAAGITQLCYDGVLVFVLLVRAWMMWAEMKRRGLESKRGKMLFWVIFWFGVWDVSGIPYVIGIGSVLVRLLPPVVALSVLLMLIRIFPDIFWFLPEEGNCSTSDPKPRIQRLSSNAFPLPENATLPNGGFTGITPNRSNNITRSTNSSLFRGIIGQGSIHPGQAVPWHTPGDGTLHKHTENLPNILDSPQSTARYTQPQHEDSLLESRLRSQAEIRTRFSNSMNGSASVVTSGPGQGFINQPRGMDLIRSDSLRTAPEYIRARVDEQFEREEADRRQDFAMSSTSVTSPNTIASFAGLPQHLSGYVPSDPRQSVAMVPYPYPPQPAYKQDRRVQSSQISPKTKLPMGYRMSNSTYTSDVGAMAQVYAQTGFSYSQEPRMAGRTLPPTQSRDQQVLYLRNIEYDDPVLVTSIMESQNSKPPAGTSTGLYTPQTPNKILRRSPRIKSPRTPRLPTHREEMEQVSTGSALTQGPIIERQRPYKRKHTRESVRVLFPREGEPQLPKTPSTPKTEKSRIGKINTPISSTKVPLPPPKSVLPPVPNIPSIKTDSGPLNPSTGGGTQPSGSLNEFFWISGSLGSPSSSSAYETADAWTVPVKPNQLSAALVELPSKLKNPKNRLTLTMEDIESFSLEESNGIRQSSLTMSTVMEPEWTGSTVIAEDDRRNQPLDHPSQIANKPTFYHDDSDRSSLAQSSVDRASSSATTQYNRISLANNIFRDYNASDESVSHSVYDKDRLKNIGDDESNGRSNTPLSRLEKPLPPSPNTPGDLNDFLDSDGGHPNGSHKEQALQDRLNANIRALADGKPAGSRFTVCPSDIPAFSTSRGAYGGRRKPPPVPLGLLPLRLGMSARAVSPEVVVSSEISSQKSSAASHGTKAILQARLTMVLEQWRNAKPMEDLLRHFPDSKHGHVTESHPPSAESDGRNSLLRLLETEAAAQESRWTGLRKSLARDSVSSVLSLTPVSAGPPESNQNSNLHRQSLLIKMRNNIDKRRMSSNFYDSDVTGWQYLTPPLPPARPRSSLRILLNPEGYNSHIPNEKDDDESLLKPLPTPFANISPSVQMHGAVFVMVSGPEGDTIVDIAAPQCPQTSPAATKLWKQKAVLRKNSVEVKSGVTLWTLDVHLEDRLSVNSIAAAVPAALETRPKKRFDEALPVILSDHLWAPANLGSKVGGNIQKVWLWNNPRMISPRSIMMQHRRPSARKRVTFTEEVITVETTGRLGRLRSLTMGSKLPSPPPVPKMTRLELINITKKYEHKALPEIPQHQGEIPPPHTASKKLQKHIPLPHVSQQDKPLAVKTRETTPMLARKDSDTLPNTGEPTSLTFEASMDIKGTEDIIPLPITPASPVQSNLTPVADNKPRPGDNGSMLQRRSSIQKQLLPMVYKQNGVWRSRYGQSMDAAPGTEAMTKLKLMKVNGVWKSVRQSVNSSLRLSYQLDDVPPKKVSAMDGMRTVLAPREATIDAVSKCHTTNTKEKVGTSNDLPNQKNIPVSSEHLASIPDRNGPLNSDLPKPEVFEDEQPRQLLVLYKQNGVWKRRISIQPIDPPQHHLEKRNGVWKLHMVDAVPSSVDENLPESRLVIYKQNGVWKRRISARSHDAHHKDIAKRVEAWSPSHLVASPPAIEMVPEIWLEAEEVVRQLGPPETTRAMPLQLFKQNGVWKVLPSDKSTSYSPPTIATFKQNGVWKRQQSQLPLKLIHQPPTPTSVKLNGAWKTFVCPQLAIELKALRPISNPASYSLHRRRSRPAALVIDISATRDAGAYTNKSTVSTHISASPTAGGKLRTTVLTLASPYFASPLSGDPESPILVSAKAARCMRASLVIDVKYAPQRRHDDPPKAGLHPSNALTEKRKAQCDLTRLQTSHCDIKPITPRGCNLHLTNTTRSGTPPPEIREVDIDGSSPATHNHLLALDSAATSSPDAALPHTNIRVGNPHIRSLDLTQLHLRDEESQLSSLSIRSSAMAAAVSSRPQLWTKSTPSTADLFAYPPPPTLRPKAVKKPDPAPASGSLWQKSDTSKSSGNESRQDKQKQPELWRPEPDKALWSHHGEEVTLEDLAAARKEIAEAWCQERHAGGLFANQNVPTARSKREGALPKVEHGLWRKRVQENEEKTKPLEARHTTLWVGRAPPTLNSSSKNLLSSSSTPPSNTSTSAKGASPILWSPNTDSASAPSLFAHLPTASTPRSKKEASTDNLPVFSEDLWKSRCSLPPHPSLWTPPIRPTGLWTASPATVGPLSLQELAAERKAAQKLLWSRKRARRTTDARPVERTLLPFRPSDAPLPKMTGSMWKKPSPTQHKGLWKREVYAHTVAPGTVSPKVPLWSKSTARRTTESRPTRSEPKKLVHDTRELPVFSGTMWTKDEAKSDPKKKLWEKDEPNPPSTPKLWNQQPTRKTQIPKPERIPDFDAAAVLYSQCSPLELWSRPPSPQQEKKTLWEPPSSSPSLTSSASTVSSSSASPSHESKTATQPLWSKSTARRTTDSSPVRPELAKRKPSIAPLEKATGGLWGDGDMPPALSRVSTFESAVSDESDDEFRGEVGGAHGEMFAGGGVRVRSESTASALGEWLWHGREAESRGK